MDNEREYRPWKWDIPDIKWFLEFWDEKKLKIPTQVGYFCTLCLLAEHYQNYIPSNYKIRWPPTMPERRWLELEDAIKVAKCPKDPRQDLGIELMLRMGRRRIECIRALISDMHYSAPEPYMYVDGKGHKRHNMPFAEGTDKKLFRYLDWRHKELKEVLNDHTKKVEAVDNLFIWTHGRKWGSYDPNKGTAWDKWITNAISAQTGIYFSNHDLRRTFGRELYFTSKVDIAIIQSYYNHESMDMTMWYIGADQKRMSDAIKKLPF
jgi:integrase/recombinase XerD